MEKFLELFDGWSEDHIELSPDEKDDTGKVRGDYKTVRGPITAEMVERHFAGQTSLGASPLRKDGTVVFGAIDVDIPDMDPDLVSECVARIRATSAFFWSKSRGIHVYVFACEPVPAKLMLDYLAMLRKRLPKQVQAAAKELFPKQTDPREVKSPSAINLPMFGKAREPIIALAPDAKHLRVGDNEEPTEMFRLIHEHCRVSRDFIQQALKNRQVVVDTQSAGYRVPEDAPGRQELLWRIACSMQARGWPDDELEAELRRLNEACFHSVFDGKGPLEERRLADIIKRVRQKEKGAPAQLNYLEVEKFNCDFAVIDIDGKLEFLDRKAADFRTYTFGDFRVKTANRLVPMKGKLVPVLDLWLRDIDRAEFDGVVTEPLGYSGRAYNIWRGFAVQPMEGDPTPFIEVVRDILCGGDADAARWVIHWLADAVQRPTEPSPPTALALRGPQGHGKSYLVEFLTAIFGPRYVQWVQESERLFSRFNRELFGATIIAAEESIFHGSPKVANTLKSFISSPLWTYEAKHKAALQAKNVHRLIATTNSDHAVHLDHDDRRWTVIDVPRRWDTSTEEGRAAANADWEPYWQFLRGDGPAIVLHHLLSVEVDRNLIRFGHITDAKAEDKMQSSPVLAVLDEMAETAIAPHDMDGRGIMSAKSFHEAVQKQGGLSARTRSVKEVMTEFDKLVPGCETVRNARYVKDVRTFSTKDLGAYAEPLIERDQRGRDLGSLAAFREAVAKHTRRSYDAEGEWRPWTPPDLNGISSVEREEHRDRVLSAQERGDALRGDNLPF